MGIRQHLKAMQSHKDFELLAEALPTELLKFFGASAPPGGLLIQWV